MILLESYNEKHVYHTTNRDRLTSCWTDDDMVMIKEKEWIEMILWESYNEKHVFHTTNRDRLTHC